MLTLEADAARERYQKIYARFAAEPAGLDLPGAQMVRRRGRELEVVAYADRSGLLDRFRAHSPEALVAEPRLEEIVVSTLQSWSSRRMTPRPSLKRPSSRSCGRHGRFSRLR